jgi:hypothetical protein
MELTILQQYTIIFLKIFFKHEHVVKALEKKTLYIVKKYSIWIFSILF